MTKRDESIQEPTATLLPAFEVLITESVDKFNRVRDAFLQEIKPRGIIDEILVADTVQSTWEIVRLRRCKAVIVNLSYRAALKTILRTHSDIGSDIYNDIDNLSYYYFTNRRIKKRVLRFLAEFQLDESAIEAEAIRKSAEDLERLDRLLASLEARRNRALRCIAEFRGDFARRLRDGANPIIDGEVLALEHEQGKVPSAVA
jgi:hypothetical protein